MKICIATDLHLSYRQYGLEEREKDFYNQYKKLIQEIIKEKPEAFLLLGDIFDTPYPKPISIKTFNDGLQQLQDSNIPTYGIAGNHTLVQRKEFYPIDNIFRKYQLLNGTGTTIGDTYICGVNYHPKTHDIKGIIDKLHKESEGHRTSIIMLHQTLKQDQNIGYEFDENQLGLHRFNYVLVGHFHNRITRKTGNTTIHYPGSLNSCSTVELLDEKANGKGYSVLDTDEGTLETKNIKPPRQYNEYTLTDDELNSKNINAIIESISQLERKPIVQLNIHNPTNPHLHELKEKLGKHALIIKQNNMQEQSKTIQKSISTNIMSIREQIAEELEEEWEKGLAVNLYDALKNGDIETGEEIAEKTYNTHLK